MTFRPCSGWPQDGHVKIGSSGDACTGSLQGDVCARDPDLLFGNGFFNSGGVF